MSVSPAFNCPPLCLGFYCAERQDYSLGNSLKIHIRSNKSHVIVLCFNMSIDYAINQLRIISRKIKQMLEKIY